MTTYYFADLFWDAMIVRFLTHIFHVGVAITVGALMDVDAVISRVFLETPLATFITSVIVIPPIGEHIRGLLCLW